MKKWARNLAFLILSIHLASLSRAEVMVDSYSSAHHGTWVTSPKFTFDICKKTLSGVYSFGLSDQQVKKQGKAFLDRLQQKVIQRLESNQKRWSQFLCDSPGPSKKQCLEDQKTVVAESRSQLKSLRLSLALAEPTRNSSSYYRNRSQAEKIKADISHPFFGDNPLAPLTAREANAATQLLDQRVKKFTLDMAMSHRDGECLVFDKKSVDSSYDCTEIQGRHDNHLRGSMPSFHKEYGVVYEKILLANPHLRFIQSAKPSDDEILTSIRRHRQVLNQQIKEVKALRPGNRNHLLAYKEVAEEVLKETKPLSPEICEAAELVASSNELVESGKTAGVIGAGLSGFLLCQAIKFPGACTVLSSVTGVSAGTYEAYRGHKRFQASQAEATAGMTSFEKVKKLKSSRNTALALLPLEFIGFGALGAAGDLARNGRVGKELLSETAETVTTPAAKVGSRRAQEFAEKLKYMGLDEKVTALSERIAKNTEIEKKLKYHPSSIGDKKSIARDQQRVDILKRMETDYENLIEATEELYRQALKENDPRLASQLRAQIDDYLKPYLRYNEVKLTNAKDSLKDARYLHAAKPKEFDRIKERPKGMKGPEWKYVSENAPAGTDEKALNRFFRELERTDEDLYDQTLHSLKDGYRPLMGGGGKNGASGFSDSMLETLSRQINRGNLSAEEIGKRLVRFHRKVSQAEEKVLKRVPDSLDNRYIHYWLREVEQQNPTLYGQTLRKLQNLSPDSVAWREIQQLNSDMVRPTQVARRFVKGHISDDFINFQSLVKEVRHSDNFGKRIVRYTRSKVANVPGRHNGVKKVVMKPRADTNIIKVRLRIDNRLFAAAKNGKALLSEVRKLAKGKSGNYVVRESGNEVIVEATGNPSILFENQAKYLNELAGRFH